MKRILPPLFLALFFALLYKLYMPRINAFGCFDDCFNLMGGYFITKGHLIFKDFYFNHQPLMAYVSAFIQFLTQPQSIAELILRHRQFIFLFSFLMSVVLYFRFGYKIIFAVILYEIAKFYVFGDRFLAEGMVSYLIVYQCAVLYERFINKKVFKYDLFLMPLATWSVVFLREPYLLATLFLYGNFLFPIFKKERKKAWISMGIFILLSLITVITNSPSDYFFNVVTVNQNILASDALNEPILQKLIKIIFYPVYFVLSSEPWTILRSYVAILSLVFISALLLLGIKFKQWKLLFFTVIVLTFVNLRPGPANVQFYEAFNLAAWLFTLIVSTIYIISYILRKSIKTGIVLSIILTVTALSLLTNKNYFGYEKVSTHEEFFTNYSYVMDIGTTIRNLSSQNDTLFVDGYDDLIIWETGLNPSYKHVWYTSFMPHFQKYTKTREEMFLKNPPDFYYGLCLKDIEGKPIKVSSYLSNNYLQLSKTGGRGCVLIHKNKVKQVNPSAWRKINKERFELQN